MLTVTLKKGRDKPVRNNHPWVFSGAIDKVSGNAAPGDPCQVRSAGGELLGSGYYNAQSSIAVRLLCRGSAVFDDRLLGERLAAAIGRRSSIADGRTDVCRLVNSEGDLLPGLIVDQYGRGVCIQILTAGMERFRARIMDHLVRIAAPAYVYERSDPESRSQEGLEQTGGCLQGSLDEPLVVSEHGVKYRVDLARGQKTGFFADQRENRCLLRAYAGNRRVLDCFCYAGGFGLNARAAGAKQVVAVDISDEAVALAAQNAALNGHAPAAGEFVKADVFSFLRETTPGWDAIVLDPPKFAKHQREVDRAARGYKDINLQAMKKLGPEGVLFTFSCSQAVDSRLFRQIVFAAAADSGRHVQVLHVLSQPPDHPFHLAHLEGEYLKGLVLRVL